MKYPLAAVVIISFASVALFGAFAMHDAMNHSGGCIAATAEGTDCPMQLGFFDHVFFHANAFLNFSMASLTKNSAAALSALLLLLISVGSGILLSSPFLMPAAAPSMRAANTLVPSQTISITRWLSLFENSPSQR